MRIPFTDTDWEATDEDTFDIGCSAVMAHGEPVLHVENWDGDGPDCDAAKEAAANLRLAASGPKLVHNLIAVLNEIEARAAECGDEPEDISTTYSNGRDILRYILEG